jgi:hypothetical protein
MTLVVASRAWSSCSCSATSSQVCLLDCEDCPNFGRHTPCVCVCVCDLLFPFSPSPCLLFLCLAAVWRSVCYHLSCFLLVCVLLCAGCAFLVCKSKTKQNNKKQNNKQTHTHTHETNTKKPTNPIHYSIIDVSRNKLESSEDLFETLTSFTALADLDMSSNALTYLPENLSVLKALTVLAVSDNQLKGCRVL